ncbi:MAG: hypothetical protein KAT62_12695 [Desulfuromonadales bacterium]|nr:hypothetical protein [Desulfuromonadales bacterium]
MTPQEVMTAVEAAIEAKSLVPIWAYILLAILYLPLVYLVTFSRKTAEIKATNNSFKETLDRIEIQVNSVKAIEERISHTYLEVREISRIKREKLELIYEMANKEIELLSNNLAIVVSDIKKDLVFPGNKTQMLISLYFRDEMTKELLFYLEQRAALITHIRKLSQANYERNNQQQSMTVNVTHSAQGNQLFANLNQAKVNIELALEVQMEKLTKRSSADVATCPVLPQPEMENCPC